MQELSSIPLTREERMGQVYITVGTGLIYSRTAATMFGGVSKVYGENPDPSELELRRAVAGVLGRDEHSLTDEAVWAALMREMNRRRRSKSAPAA